MTEKVIWNCGTPAFGVRRQLPWPAASRCEQVGKVYANLRPRACRRQGGRGPHKKAEILISLCHPFHVVYNIFKKFYVTWKSEIWENRAPSTPGAGTILSSSRRQPSEIFYFDVFRLPPGFARARKSFRCPFVAQISLSDPQ